MNRSYSISILLFWASAFQVASVHSADYIGSDACMPCHENQYNDFKVSGHPYKLMKASDAKFRALPLPKGYTWDDISYVIGGAHKKSRYINKQGYIITSAKDGSDLKTQYNLETGTWSYYHKGEKKPYDCGRCHTTAYNKQGHQDNLEGIVGTWKAPGIQCEACHGPGGLHAKTGDKTKIKVDRTSEGCGECHRRGKPALIPAKNAYIRHHEQYNELLANKHQALSCVTCHNPHKRAKFSIKSTCATCHTKQAADFEGSTMHQTGVRCIDCHMPKAVKSATAKHAYEADVRTHLFKINSQSDEMFYNEKVNGKTKTFAKGFINLGFACLACHKNKDIEWAKKQVKNIHSIGK